MGGPGAYGGEGRPAKSGICEKDRSAVIYNAFPISMAIFAVFFFILSKTRTGRHLSSGRRQSVAGHLGRRRKTGRKTNKKHLILCAAHSILYIFCLERFLQSGAARAPFVWGKRFWTTTDAGVSEWQTMRTQNPLVATPCGFKSHHRHHVAASFVSLAAIFFIKLEM